jgi:hypothetical protein
LAVQPFHLQRPEQRLAAGVDAPMSSRMRGIGQDKRIQLTHDVALEAAVDFLFRQTLAGAPGDLLAGACIASHSNHSDGPQGVVCLPLTAAIESMAARLS